MKLTIGVNRKDGRPNFSSEGATCSLELELDQALLDSPGLLHERIRATFATCEAAVLEQLDSAPDGDEGCHGDPLPPAIAARMTPPPAARPALPAPSTPPPVVPANNGSAKRYYDDRRSARSSDGPPATGKVLYGWARDNNCLAWFTKFGKLQNPPLPHLVSDFPDDWAVYAYDQYQAACSAAPTNGTH